MTRAARRLAALTALLAGLVVGGALLAGCAVVGERNRNEEDRVQLDSQVPGIELIHTPGAEAAWSPDGRVIAVQSRQWIEFRRPDGTAVGKIEAPPLEYEFDSPEPLRFSADGRHLFYVTTEGPGRSRQLRGTEVRRRGGGVRQIALGTEFADAGFAAHGWPLVYATGPYEFGLHMDRHGPPASIWKVSGPGAKPQRLLRVAGVPWEPVVGEHTVLFKQSLRKKTELWSVGLDGSAPHRLARFTYLRHYAFAPDGRDIAFAATPRRARTYLYLLAAGHGRPQRVSSAEVHDGPIWSPDGRWLVFSTPEGEIRRVHPDGHGEGTIAAAPGEEIEWLAFFPDGRRLLYGAHPRPSEPAYGD